MLSWKGFARLLLKNRISWVLVLLGLTAFLSLQIPKIQYAYTEVDLLSEKHPDNVLYQKFLKIFGEEGNLLTLAVKDESIFTPQKMNAWQRLSQKIDSFPQVIKALNVTDLQVLTRDTISQKMKVRPLHPQIFTSQRQVTIFRTKLFNDFPFYENLLFNPKTQSLITAVYLQKDFVNTEGRKDFILNTLIPLVANFEKQNDLQVRISGMPYIRTMNSQNIRAEMRYFILIALFFTGFVFYFFFRSWRATLITLLVVSVGVIWSFSFISYLGYQITILTALIPPVLIVIGIPNAIFIINKYQQEIKNHKNKIKALQRVIIKIGDATFMTNLTTAVGFMGFAFTDSKSLQEFGVIASVSILSIFILALVLIPALYSWMPPPKFKHLKHLDKTWINKIINLKIKLVQNQKKWIYISSLAIAVVSIIGFSKIKTSGSILDDVAKNSDFFEDIVFFQEELGGIIPVEILIDTQRKNGVQNLKTLQKADSLQKIIDSIPELSKPISLVNIVKYSKQAFYNGDRKYYSLPTAGEQTFVGNFIKKSELQNNILERLTDKNGRYLRMTTYMKSTDTPTLKAIKSKLTQAIAHLFPKNKYHTILTGKALVFMNVTHYLSKNLIFSLSLAILIISIFMLYHFKSLKMILIALLPNLFPLLFTAGLMGYLDIPIKASTILVFSIAFGIAVDDTIHFLTKYRQERKRYKNQPQKCVYTTLKETGISMFYSSIVLFFGFLSFVLSSFGGTKALGGLISITLLFAMVTNLLLLPCLLLWFENTNDKKLQRLEKKSVQ